MCTTYTTYYSCGHLRSQRLVRCARRHEHLLATVRNTHSTLDCRSCAQQQRRRRQKQQRRRWWHDASDDGSVDFDLDLDLDVDLDVGHRDDRDYYDYEYECYERSYRHYPWREREWRRWLLMLD
ncbi:bed3367d-d3e2-4e09-84ac-ac7bd96f2b76 [Thermothielavioides terrestris]|uniref:Bed3367d-d3e2-4e09-84ac-ac7bd96f2b76 n=1 Tax=Thermothielavioides terrestris TaxID=2587410 RepID=A0A3S4F459_9PEZI|nr:bed3367d-d3e2-4e09-84ac-ac7bd96f2b76 [Thermothielavioides terrestris]